MDLHKIYKLNKRANIRSDIQQHGWLFVYELVHKLVEKSLAGEQASKMSIKKDEKRIREEEGSQMDEKVGRTREMRGRRL